MGSEMCIRDRALVDPFRWDCKPYVRAEDGSGEAGPSSLGMGGGPVWEIRCRTGGTARCRVAGTRAVPCGELRNSLARAGYGTAGRVMDPSVATPFAMGHALGQSGPELWQCALGSTYLQCELAVACGEWERGCPCSRCHWAARCSQMGYHCQIFLSREKPKEGRYLRVPCKAFLHIQRAQWRVQSGLHCSLSVLRWC